jgi:hypothetical protein
MDRRRFITHLTGAAAAAALAPSLASSTAWLGRRRRPNVLLIMADDLG